MAKQPQQLTGRRPLPPVAKKIEIWVRAHAFTAGHEVDRLAALGSGRLLGRSGASWRSGDVSLFIDKVEILVVASHSVLDQNFRVAFTRLRLLADITVAVDEVEILLIITFQVEVFHFFGHSILLGNLDGLDVAAAASSRVAELEPMPPRTTLLGVVGPRLFDRSY